MILEQESLVLAILCQLDRNSLSGEWPNEICKHCDGESSGYWDYQSFDHEEGCLVLLVEKLRTTIRKEQL